MAAAEFAILSLRSAGGENFSRLGLLATQASSHERDIATRLRLDLSLSESLRRVGRVQTAIALLDQSEIVARRHSAYSELGWTLWGRANLLRQSGDSTGHAKYLAVAMDLAKTCRDRKLYAYALAGLGEQLRIRRQFGQSFGIHRTCLTLFSDMKDLRGVAWALQGMAQMHLKGGNLLEANRDFSLAYSFSEEIGESRSIAYSLKGLGETCAALGDVDQGKRLLENAKLLFAHIELTVGQGYALKSLGDIDVQLGDYPVALERFANAAKLFRRTRHRRGLAYVWLGLGRTYSRIGQTQRAVRLLSNACYYFTVAGIDGGREEAMRELERVSIG